MASLEAVPCLCDFLDPGHNLRRIADRKDGPGEVQMKDALGHAATSPESAAFAAVRRAMTSAFFGRPRLGFCTTWTLVGAVVRLAERSHLPRPLGDCDGRFARND